jgi:cell division protein FtsW
MSPRKTQRVFRAGETQPTASIDRWIAVTLLGILVLGSMTVYSASSISSTNLTGDHTLYFFSHVKKILLGLVMCLVMLKVDYHRLQRWAVPSALIFLALLVSTLVFPAQLGARRWVQIAGFSLQPIDFFKFAFVLYVAAVLSTVRDFRKDYKKLLPCMSVFFLALAVLFVQPNYSMLLVLGGVVSFLIFMAGFPLRWAAWLSVPVLGAAFALMMQGGYRAVRVQSWLAAFMNPMDAKFQMKHSFVAMGNGGLFGQGAGESVQKLLLPEPFNDFIFAIFCEEHGLLGALILVALYAMIFMRGMHIVKRAPDEFGRLLAAGIIGLFTCHTLVNLMVTTGLIPATGQPLPLFSYGGTAMVTMLAGFGVLLNISYQSRSLNLGGRQ